MERLKKSKNTRGLTLLELMIALVLLTVVLITASSTLASFHKFYYDFGQNSGSITEVSLGVLEEIVNRIIVANDVSVSANNTKIDIKIDEANTPSAYADDAAYTYYKNDDTILYSKNGAAAKTIARNISSLQFANSYGNRNAVKIKIGITPPNSAERIFNTAAVMRCRRAQGSGSDFSDPSGDFSGQGIPAGGYWTDSGSTGGGDRCSQVSDGVRQPDAPYLDDYLYGAGKIYFNMSPLDLSQPVSQVRVWVYFGSIYYSGGYVSTVKFSSDGWINHSDAVSIIPDSASPKWYSAIFDITSTSDLSNMVLELYFSHLTKVYAVYIEI